jgi:hypothetical protein
MQSKTLEKKLARLEFINDQLLTELQLLEHLAHELGFEEGLNTLKLAAKELIEEQKASKEGKYPPG